MLTSVGAPDARTGSRSWCRSSRWNVADRRRRALAYLRDGDCRISCRSCRRARRSRCGTSSSLRRRARGSWSISSRSGES